MTVVQVLHLHVTLLQERRNLWVNSLMNAQGEDVVAGVRTPHANRKDGTENSQKHLHSSKKFAILLRTTTEICRIWSLLLRIENSIMLQTRNGKRTAQAALKIACDLVDEGMRTEEEAVAMIDPRNLDTLLHPQFDAAALESCYTSS